MATKIKVVPTEVCQSKEERIINALIKLLISIPPVIIALRQALC
jgi:hypothetical protein